MVAGTGEPEAAQERESRGGAGTGEPGAAQEREIRGGAGTGEPGAVLPGAARWRAKK